MHSAKYYISLLSDQIKSFLLTLERLNSNRFGSVTKCNEDFISIVRKTFIIIYFQLLLFINLNFYLYFILLERNLLSHYNYSLMLFTNNDHYFFLSDNC